MPDPHLDRLVDHLDFAVDLVELQVDVGAHLDRLGVERSDWVRVGKIAEEGGEVLGALIKRTQGRCTDQHVRDEIGDVLLAALGACDQLDVDVSQVILDRWKAVSRRDR